LELFRKYVYGRVPHENWSMESCLCEEEPEALDGSAIRKQGTVTLRRRQKSLGIDFTAFLPPESEDRPVPAFLFLNFAGNHAISFDDGIFLTENWLREDFRPPEQNRGLKFSRFPLLEIVRRGYGLVTAYYGDIDPDFDDGFKNGAHALLDSSGGRTDDAWGSVAAWAWGLSRLMDYIETDRHIDSQRVAVGGHSRLGKAALWAGAQDERFAMVISNESGSTGAAMARGKQGESVEIINDRFPHWFCRNYRSYNNKEEELPVDQHMLLSCLAPRPLYVASAEQDTWCDPEAEFRSGVHAGAVYRLFGKEGLESEEMPGIDQPLLRGNIGYHCRIGGHDLMAYDWQCFMDFADRCFYGGREKAEMGKGESRNWES
jgi:hypothetical protein